MELTLTADGSHTLVHASMNKSQTYHSRHGAITESRHVFLEMGLRAASRPQLSILEVGFGTGLNALLTLVEALGKGLQVYYYAVEPQPIELEVASQLNYPDLLKTDREAFLAIHRAMANAEKALLKNDFQFYPHKSDFQSLVFPQAAFDLVYFDAFSPNFQPDMWKIGIFQKLFQCMREDAILVTYCAQAAMQRAMKTTGFRVERLPGAPGKREMVRARKPAV